MENSDALSKAVRKGQPIQDLGLDKDLLLTLVREESNGPFAVPLFFWLCAQTDDSPAAELAVELINATLDPAVLAEIVDLLSKHSINDVFRRQLSHSFLRRVCDRAQNYGVRAQALHGTLLLAQFQKGLLHQLKGYLTDLEINDDSFFLRHCAKILGIVLAHSPEPEFREKLCELLEIPEARDEAAMELGFDSLRQGLDATTHEPAAKAFEAALRWFSIALDSSEERVDAQLYKCCLSILVDVQQKGFNSNAIVDIEGLSDAAWRYSAYLGSDDVEHCSWLGAQSSERLHWTLLASKLGTFNIRLKKKVWMDAVSAIEDELLAIYRSSRSILLKDRDTGLDDVIRPQLTTSLQLHRRHLDELEQWLEENEGSVLLPDAVAMLEAVEKAREASILHHPFKQRSEGQTLQAIYDAGQVPLEARASIAALLQCTLSYLSPNENPKAEWIVHNILSQMERNRDFMTIAPARSLFTSVLILSVYFLVHRHETGRASDPNGAYLFIRGPDSLPLESALQEDYFRFMRTSGLRDHVHMEVRDVGAGRADVYFKASGVSTITEVKRTMQDLDHCGLLQSYGLQTAAYQTTNVTFGFLLVLDLWDRGGGQPHITEQISLQSRKPPQQTTDYDVVVMRVQGQRKSPSNLR